jgi:asparagine synthase (glutamine-hydrolysing)
MCGIAGFTLPVGLSAKERHARHAERLRAMTAALRHRGPDAQTALLADGAALGHTRLSIVDLSGGHQPIVDPQTGVAIIFNGEIFNYLELRAPLEQRYAFRTKSDTEVILASFLAHGIDCVRGFIGQFAFAIWDPRDQTLWLARDRVGVRPLYYATTDDGVAFASEARALFASGVVAPQLDARAVKDTLSLWSPVCPRSAFEGVAQLPPGTVMRVRGRELQVTRYWDLDLTDFDRSLDEKQALGRLGELLEDAVRLRLRADVPVAAYLSGGIDSSLISAIAQSQLGGTLSTFSVAFTDARYDESRFQHAVADALKTKHHAVTIGDADIGELLPQVVEHAEQVLLRSAPAPLFRLSRLVLDHRTKVVLTGEGADEFFWGYDLYKETRVRQFWARQPNSAHRHRLFGRLYPYLPLQQQSPEMLRQFYGIGLDAPQSLAFSHLIRWTNSGRIARFLSPAFEEKVQAHDPLQSLAASLPSRVATWRPLARAQYLEMQTLLSGYLLSAQGDRMLMGNSVEGRFPFLDHRLIEFAARVPDALKLRGLKEKYLLKRYGEKWVPREVFERHKQPYRAPIARSLAGPQAPAWAKELLSREAVDQVGIFDGAKVSRLVAKLGAAAQAASPSEADNMAVMAVASTQLLAHACTRGFAPPAADLAAVQFVS